MARRGTQPSKARGKRTRRRRKAGVENPPSTSATPPIDLKNPSELLTDEEWWATYCPGTFKNTAEHNEASNRLQYYLDTRDGLIKGRYDEKGRLLVPWKQKPEPESELKPQPKLQSKPKLELKPGSQLARAIESLIKAFPPDGKVPKGMSVKAARAKALRYLPHDPDKGLPDEETYRRAIKRLGRRE
jgi:hypothetical protein